MSETAWAYLAGSVLGFCIGFLAARDVYRPCDRKGCPGARAGTRSPSEDVPDETA